MQNPNIGYQNQGQAQVTAVNQQNRLSSDMTSRILEQLPPAPTAAAGSSAFRSGPVSSRTRRALQMSVSRYETPEEEDELLHEEMQAQYLQQQQQQQEMPMKPRRTASYIHNNPLRSNLVEEPLKENAVSNYTLPKRYSNGNMGLAPGVMPSPQDLSDAFTSFQNPYPTPSPSARQEMDFRAVNPAASAHTPAMSNTGSTTPSTISKSHSGSTMASMSMSRGVGLGLATNGLKSLPGQQMSPTSMTGQWRTTPPYDDANAGGGNGQGQPHAISSQWTQEAIDSNSMFR